MLKALTNEQRSRLEMIANDEFAIRQREVSRLKQEALEKWIKENTAKAEKNPLVKEFSKAYKLSQELGRKLRTKGISVSFVKAPNSYEPTVSLIRPSDYRSDGAASYPGLKEQTDKTKIDQDAFTRAKNEVMSVIWSMEKPFNECVKLIKDKVSKIK